MYPEFEIPVFTRMFIGAIAIFAIAYGLHQKLYPVTLADIKKMSLDEVIKYLRDTPVIERSGNLWNTAVNRGISQVTSMTEATKVEELRLILDSQPSVNHSARLRIRVGEVVYGSLEPAVLSLVR